VNALRVTTELEKPAPQGFFPSYDVQSLGFAPFGWKISNRDFHVAHTLGPEVSPNRLFRSGSPRWAGSVRAGQLSAIKLRQL
jgi:hypothetical protein